jgi:hypothetical protein
MASLLLVSAGSFAVVLLWPDFFCWAAPDADLAAACFSASFLAPKAANGFLPVLPVTEAPLPGAAGCFDLMLATAEAAAFFFAESADLSLGPFVALPVALLEMANLSKGRDLALGNGSAGGMGVSEDVAAAGAVFV